MKLLWEVFEVTLTCLLFTRSWNTLGDVPGLNCTSHGSLKPKRASHHRLFDCFLLICLLWQLLWRTRSARAAPWTNQMGYIIVIARVARDLWQRKPPLSSGYALGLGSVYCHKSLAPCYNYNLWDLSSDKLYPLPTVFLINFMLTLYWNKIFRFLMYHPTKWLFFGKSKCSKFVFTPMPHFKDGCYRHSRC